MVSTFKLCGCTEFVTVRLVCTILTIVFLITCPAHWNAAPTGTCKEVDRTFNIPLILTVSLIRVVSTVIVAVTLPGGQVTKSCFLTALERSSFHAQSEETGAVGGLAVHLIACVLTVHHLVTTAEVRNAASIFALELSLFAQSHVAW